VEVAGVAELQSRRLHRRDEVQVRGVELDLPVEGADGLVEIAGVPGAELIQRAELVGVQAGDQIHGALFDVVHLRRAAEADR
jgi:hypothetical protein